MFQVWAVSQHTAFHPGIAARVIYLLGVMHSWWHMLQLSCHTVVTQLS